jgi:succinyl-CoA synthetase alpha subunit
MIVRGNETVLVQGITGRQGTFWSERMIEYGTRIIGGVNPKKAGEVHIGLPVWGSAVDAARETDIGVSVLFIPPLGVKAAALDAIKAGIGKLVIMTEHVPVQDVMHVMAAAKAAGTRIVGPNTAGLGRSARRSSSPAASASSRAAAASARWSASTWCVTDSAWSRWTRTSAPTPSS